jgi:hypothetical protein
MKEVDGTRSDFGILDAVCKLLDQGHAVAHGLCDSTEACSELRKKAFEEASEKQEQDEV